MPKHTHRDELASLIDALRPFAVQFSMASGARIKVRLDASLDASPVLSKYEGIIEPGSGVLYIPYGERDASEVIKLLTNESTEPHAEPDEEL